MIENWAQNSTSVGRGDAERMRWDGMQVLGSRVQVSGFGVRTGAVRLGRRGSKTRRETMQVQVMGSCGGGLRSRSADRIGFSLCLCVCVFLCAFVRECACASHSQTCTHQSRYLPRQGFIVQLLVPRRAKFHAGCTSHTGRLPCLRTRP